jgi:histone acetyltransferase (RNA polymerase elongator complex component)
MIFAANRYGAELRTVEIIAEFVDEETVASFKKAHIISVETGPQTVNEDTLQKVNRFYKADKFKHGVRLLEDNGIEVTSDLIIGLPGTVLYEKSNEFGLKFDDKTPHLVLDVPDFPYEDIDKAVIMAYSIDKEYNIKPSG